MGPRGFWIALAILLFYLIARPHVGTVWYVALDSLPTPAATLPAGLTPISPPAGFIPDSDRTPPSARFTDKRDCFNAEMRFRSAYPGATGTYCDSETALLWGW